MTSKEFVIWLKGFVSAANEYNITPKQFEAITEQLEKVSDDPSILNKYPYMGTTTTGVPVGIGGGGVTNINNHTDKTLLKG